MLKTLFETGVWFSSLTILYSKDRRHFHITLWSRNKWMSRSWMKGFISLSSSEYRLFTCCISHVVLAVETKVIHQWSLLLSHNRRQRLTVVLIPTVYWNKFIVSNNLNKLKDAFFLTGKKLRDNSSEIIRLNNFYPQSSWDVFGNVEASRLHTCFA